MRWVLPGKGKSGGIPILYVDFPSHELLYFISLIKKNEKENISKEDKNTISRIIVSIEKNLSAKKEKGGKNNESNKKRK
jgi:hypothetical protein